MICTMPGAVRANPQLFLTVESARETPNASQGFPGGVVWRFLARLIVDLVGLSLIEFS
jgi:hypothetical protein